MYEKVRVHCDVDPEVYIDLSLKEFLDWCCEDEQEARLDLPARTALSEFMGQDKREAVGHCFVPDRVHN